MFKYLRRVLTVGYDDWAAVSGNLKKVRKQLMRMARILIQYGGRPKGLEVIL